MDLWRILLIGAVVVGVVLFLLPGAEEVPGLIGGEQIEGGTYVVERAGQPAIEETFSVWRVEAGYRVATSTRVGRQVVEAALVLDTGWNPIYYVERSKGQVSVRVAGGRPVITRGTGLFKSETVLMALPPYAIVGGEVVGPWFATYRYLQAQARAAQAEVTAVLPAQRAVAPLVGQPTEAVELAVGGRLLPAERMIVRVGDQELTLYGQGELLLAMTWPSAGLVFYLKEMLPEGLTPVP